MYDDNNMKGTSDWTNRVNLPFDMWQTNDKIIYSTWLWLDEVGSDSRFKSFNVRVWQLYMTTPAIHIIIIYIFATLTVELYRHAWAIVLS